MSGNNDVLDTGFAKGLSLIRQTIVGSLTEAAYKLLLTAEWEKEYHNLTGNTFTSYMVGIYYNRSLVRIISVYDADLSLRRPVRGKLWRGSGIGTIYVEDYDSGKMVPVKKYRLIDTDKDYGENTSRNFLRSYRPSDDIEFVMCTGTEYSQLLETVRHLDVLTGTFMEAPKIINNSWKRIPD